MNRLNKLTSKTNMLLKFNGQLAADNLDGADQLSLGGPSAVRAYPSNEAAGDTGFDDAGLVGGHRGGRAPPTRRCGGGSRARTASRSRTPAPPRPRSETQRSGRLRTRYPRGDAAPRRRTARDRAPDAGASSASGLCRPRAARTGEDAASAGLRAPEHP